MSNNELIKMPRIAKEVREAESRRRGEEKEWEKYLEEEKVILDK